MNPRERFQAVMNQQAAHCDFWHGNLHPASTKNLFSAFEVPETFIRPDCLWSNPGDAGM